MFNGLIYSLKLIKLKILKIYIIINFASSFIRLFEFFYYFNTNYLKKEKLIFTYI